MVRSSSLDSGLKGMPGVLSPTSLVHSYSWRWLTDASLSCPTQPTHGLACTIAKQLIQTNTSSTRIRLSVLKAWARSFFIDVATDIITSEETFWQTLSEKLSINGGLKEWIFLHEPQLQLASYPHTLTHSTPSLVPHCPTASLIPHPHR